MGLCKCPKRKVTNLFCFEHRVNVCEHCLVANHAKVRPSWEPLSRALGGQAVLVFSKSLKGLGWNGSSRRGGTWFILFSALSPARKTDSSTLWAQ